MWKTQRSLYCGIKQISFPRISSCRLLEERAAGFILGLSRAASTKTSSMSSRSSHTEGKMEKDSAEGYDRRYNKIPTVRGVDIIRNPKLNKSTAFTLEERQLLGIHGLLPPVVNTQDIQTKRIMTEVRDSRKTDLQRYVQLMALSARNERLFYRCLMDNIEELMPIVYTPTVGQACLEYALIFRQPRGLFVTVHDKGHVRDLISNWPGEKVKAVVMTDGERILGLGDLGCHGMGIPIGKLALYTACAAIHPSACLPIVVDVGTNNEKLLKDPMYIGLRQKRDRSQKYDELIDELIDAIRDRYGPNTLIQFEDFGNQNAFRFLEKYRSKICTFNDDIQGTAAVTVAGILTSLRISGMKLGDHTILFQGAGEAACGIARLLVLAMEEEGLSIAEAQRRIWLVDSRGLVVKDRASGGITHEKAPFAHEAPHVATLQEAVSAVRPTAIIGVAAVPGAFTEEICTAMKQHTERPVIFALSNPTSKAECTAEQAYNWTSGKCLFASGSPFQPVTLADGRKFIPGQGNNAYIFPGVALGVISCGARHVSESMFLAAAKALAKQVTQDDLDQGRLYPPLSTIQKVSYKLALDVIACAYREGLATVVPEPVDKDSLLTKILYDPEYPSFIPDTYDYPSIGSYM